VRKLFVVILVSAFLVTLGFSGLAAEKVEITFIGGTWRMERGALPGDFVVTKAIERFEAANPDIKVKVETYPFRELFQALEVKFSAGSDKPDVYDLDSPLNASYAVREYSLPLDEYFTKEELERYYPAALQAATWQGKLYSVPWETSTQVLFYNKALFRQAGIPEPPMDVTKRLTWEEVVEIAQKIQTVANEGKPSTEVWGFTFDQVSRLYQIQALPESCGGGSGVGPDGLSFNGYMNNEGWVRAMKFYYDLFNTWQISPKGVTPDETPLMFAGGKVAMFVGGTWNIPTFMASEGLEWGMAPHPYFKGGEVMTPTGSWHIGINPKSKYIEQGIRFAKFLTSDEIMRDWFKAIGQLVANKVMIDVIKEDPMYGEFPHSIYREVVLYELENTARPRPLTPAYLEMEDLLNKAMEDIRNGADPKETLDRYATMLDKMAEKYKK
jgi:ABC-type glycerol-3-phosphate transport system substrate-binding protein